MVEVVADGFWGEFFSLFSAVVEGFPDVGDGDAASIGLLKGGLNSVEELGVEVEAVFLGRGRGCVVRRPVRGSISPSALPGDHARPAKMSDVPFFCPGPN